MNLDYLRQNWGLVVAGALLLLVAAIVLVATNHVRKVIHEEYPPARQEALRQKYLPDDKADARPFSF